MKQVQNTSWQSSNDVGNTWDLMIPRWYSRDVYFFETDRQEWMENRKGVECFGIFTSTRSTSFGVFSSARSTNRKYIVILCIFKGAYSDISRSRQSSVIVSTYNVDPYTADWFKSSISIDWLLSWISYRNSFELWFAIQENFNFAQFYRFHTTDGPAQCINWLSSVLLWASICIYVKDPYIALKPFFYFFIFCKLQEKLSQDLLYPIPCWHSWSISSL